MAEKNIFTKLIQAKPITAAGVKASREWFRDAASKVAKAGLHTIFEQNKKNLQNVINTSSIGSLYQYYYNPKWKEKLPYYDLHPLVFVVDVYPDGFSGLNLHYLSPYNRAALMDALYGIALKEKDLMKLQISYDVLKSASRFGLYKPCYKRYLMNYVRSRFLFIEPEQWDMAILLPTQKFVKADAGTVWAASGG